jgi:hypothetical protein
VWGAKTPIGSPIWVSGHAWDALFFIEMASRRVFLAS